MQNFTEQDLNFTSSFLDKRSVNEKVKAKFIHKNLVSKVSFQNLYG